MKAETLELKVQLSSKEAEAKIKKATIAAEKLTAALNELKDIEIRINVVEGKNKWYQFWK